MELSRRLADGLRRVSPISWHGEVLRHHSPKYKALDGAGAQANGGRWNPPGSFAVVYTALDRATVDAEFGRLSHRTGLPAESFLPRRLATMEVGLARVLDLTDAGVRRRLGITLASLTDDDWTRTREIGTAAQAAGFEAVLAPGADGGETLAVFIGSLADGSSMRVLRTAAYATPAEAQPRRS